MQPTPTTCSTCGAPLPAGARFCPECGSRQGEEDVRLYGVPPAPVAGLGRRVGALRDRGRALLEELAAESQARRAVNAIRLELEQLHRERDLRLRDLGAAVYGGDGAGTEALREAVRGLDDRIAAKEAQMMQIAAGVHRHVEQVRAEARPTELLEPPQPGPQEPYPPSIPEPYPPPDEGTPPTPAPVPEPYPPPDEGDPPRQI
jgi:hypothetical protein